MLINLRNALMSGKRLPYDAELEYLESTGTQWIDTGIVYSWGQNLEATFSCNGSGTVSRFLFGIYGGNSRAQVGFNAYARWDTATAYAIFYGNPYNAKNVANNTVNTVSLNNGAWSFNNVEQATTGEVSNPSNLNLFLFAANDSNVGRANYFFQGRAYAFKIWNSNNVLVRDYIPVRKGTVGYLYDRVSGKLFGNAGTGDFVLGPDVVPVEWLDNGGTAYIDTGYVFKTKPRVVTNCMITSGNDKDLFGTPTVDASCFIFDLSLNYTVWLYYRYGSSSALTATGSNPRVGQKIHIDASDKVYIDDALILTRTGTYDFSQGSTPCRIFAARSVLPSRIYDLSMWDGDALVRKYLPVRVGTDATSWEGAMMDTLTRRIYRNAGTGAFSYGNDLKYPIPA